MHRLLPLLAVYLALCGCNASGPVAPIRVNQVGYFPSGPKFAMVASESPRGLPWKLVRGESTLAEGTTRPLGFDQDSGQAVHLIDFFGAIEEADDGFRLVVGEESSPTFAVGNHLYDDLKVDALKYFFHNRSGVAIEMPYAGEQRWTRPAGHAESDRAVTCEDSADCSYHLDVSGGWYDAGDHGKYVVNAGIAVWTLMNLHETLPHAIGDERLGIPESGNGVPDLLDEVRWELEFLLRMQVPAGKPNAGMVHHRIHDREWTQLPIAPHVAEQQMERFLQPVSTAATLNLAATAAQAARIWGDVDSDFARRCLAAAESAWTAAHEHPEIYAGPSPGGGGAYEDDEVSDEFFWAAAELWITTGVPEYEEELKASPFWTAMTESADGYPTSMTWNQTDALGTLSLLSGDVALLEADRDLQRRKVLHAAERFARLAESQGYRVPFAAGEDGGYPWGSNSFVLNNMIVLGTAYRLSREERFLNAMVDGMDYLLGRNPLGRSYVTGYGDQPMSHPHHRFWARQADPSFPEPPPGALSGGPNSHLQDPYVKSHLPAGCAPQTCWVDHYQAFSVNEVAINWNAPLAWAATYLDEDAIWLRALSVLQ